MYNAIHINLNGARGFIEERKKVLNEAHIISLQDTRLKDGQNFLQETFPQFYIYEIKHAETAGIAVLIHKSI